MEFGQALAQRDCLEQVNTGKSKLDKQPGAGCLSCITIKFENIKL